MNHIILASHSNMASGIRDTVLFFKADASVDVIQQTEQDTGFEARFRSLIQENAGKNIVVFTDLYGGSVNQTAFRNLADLSYWLVTGMNLAVVLEVCFATEDVDQEMLEQAVASGQGAMRLMNPLLSPSQDEED